MTPEEASLGEYKQVILDLIQRMSNLAAEVIRLQNELEKLKPKGD